MIRWAYVVHSPQPFSDRRSSARTLTVIPTRTDFSTTAAPSLLWTIRTLSERIRSEFTVTISSDFISIRASISMDSFTTAARFRRWTTQAALEEISLAGFGAIRSPVPTLTQTEILAVFFMTAVILLLWIFRFLDRPQHSESLAAAWLDITSMPTTHSTVFCMTGRVGSPWMCRRA